jgi:hypothetical protein
VNPITACGSNAMLTMSRLGMMRCTVTMRRITLDESAQDAVEIGGAVRRQNAVEEIPLQQV